MYLVGFSVEDIDADMALAIELVFNIITLFITIDVILSWLIYSGAVHISPNHPAVQFISSVVDPILSPIRKVINPRGMGGIDFSPFIAVILLQAIEQLLLRMLPI